MIVKGIVSAIYSDEMKVSVILPEYNNITTNPLPIYGKPDMKEFAVNDFVVVLVFNNNFNDAMVMATGQGGLNPNYRATIISLTQAKWSESEDGTYYMQPVTIASATANSRVDLQPTPEQLVMLMDEEITMYVANNDGDLTAYAIGAIPSADIKIQVLISEVVFI